jgi:O-6-methylguanine DNA methyltransferase
MSTIERIVHEERPSPIGRLVLAEGEIDGGGRAPLAVIFLGPRGNPTQSMAGTGNPLRWLKREYPAAALAPGPCVDLRRRLDRYFARREWEPIALPAEVVGTEFQRAVWKRIARIPLGRKMTYGEVASAIGAPRAARGVGQAVGANPLPIVIPCHRVVGANGGLTGYGGGLSRKEWLLEWEGAQPRRLL